MNNFSQKTLWLTGASSGIGAELATQIANKDVQLIISARNLSLLSDVANDCKLKGAKVYVAPVDMTDGASIEEAFKYVSNFVERIDYLIHCAGVSQRAHALETEINVTRTIMETNFFGVVHLTRLVAKKMESLGSGHIVTISSVAGKLGTPMRSSYSASKHALHGYFDSLRAELYKSNIYITVICPGFIQTNITLNSLKGDGSKYNKIDDALKNGVQIDVCVEMIIKGIINKKDEFVISGYKEKIGIFLKRLAPSLLFRLVREIDTVNL